MSPHPSQDSLPVESTNDERTSDASTGHTTNHDVSLALVTADMSLISLKDDSFKIPCYSTDTVLTSPSSSQPNETIVVQPNDESIHLPEATSSSTTANPVCPQTGNGPPPNTNFPPLSSGAANAAQPQVIGVMFANCPLQCFFGCHRCQKPVDDKGYADLVSHLGPEFRGFLPSEWELPFSH